MSRKSKTTPPPSPSSRIAEIYVLIASFLSGAIILVVEIVGTRVLSPYYGGSIYVWSSLISVTLASLTAGYVVGGYAADRWPRLQTLAVELIGGGIFILLVPAMRRDVLAASQPLGLKIGSLVSAAVLFTPPLILLSMTGPLAIRLVTSEFTVLGRGVGKIYGVSTLGSMLGALLTGFVLIPSFSLRSLLLGMAIVLLGLGSAGFLAARHVLAASGTAAGALFVAALLRAPSPRASNVVYHGNSFYGEIKVVDTRDERVLLINGLDNGLIDRATYESRAPYIGYFTYLPAARPQASRALCIGLGSGSVPRMFTLRFGIATDVVEIDPMIVHLARRYFGFPAEISVAAEDGRQYVERSDRRRYDIVVLDAFNSDNHPAHLFSREFFAAVDRVLVQDGVFAINMVGIPFGAPGAWRAVYATLRERFGVVRVFLGDDVTPDEVARFTNLFIVASHAALPAPDSLGGRDAREVEKFARIARRELTPTGKDAAGIVLTDDYNPLDELQRDLFVVWREDVIRKAQDVLLYDGSE